MTIQPNTSLVLGPISVPTYGPEQTDPETGAVYRPVTGYVPGSHWNIARTHLAPSLAPYEVTPDPSTPAVIWAGDERMPNGMWRDTAFLLFADDAEALAALLAAGLASETE
jgi:hypothetical protein